MPGPYPPPSLPLIQVPGFCARGSYEVCAVRREAMMRAAARGLVRAGRMVKQVRAQHGLASASSPAEPPTLPPCSFQPQPYESMSYERMRAVRHAHLSPALLSYFSRPLLLHQGHMQWLWDEDGRRYLDFFAGIVTVSVGHCHPKVTRAAEAQLSRLWHSSNIYMNPPVHEYAEKLAALLPEPLKVIYFTNSGSEANDLAMFMARAYTGNFDILSFRGGYHGASPYTMGLTNVGSYKYGVPNGFGCHAVMCPDVYRGLWGGARCRDSPVQTTRPCACAQGSCQAQDNYLEQLAEVFATSVPKKVAAFFAESIQGVVGSVQYPRGYLAEAYRMVRARGGLCIADEVQTGFGRLGSHTWGFESHGVMPDIVTMAKGIGNGFPLAAVVTSAEVASAMTTALHFNTFGGNPIACAVGSAVLDVMREDGTQALCSEVGGRLLAGLARFRDEFEVVGDVRGKGLMIGVELVGDKASRTPLPSAEMNEIWEDCKDMSLLIGKGGIYGQVFRIKPPMCITNADVDFALAVMHRALSNHRDRHAA